MFFRDMSNKEKMNFRKGVILGFYIYMLLLFINYASLLFDRNEPFSSFFIFWAGLLAAFGYEFILNIRAKMATNKRT